MAQAGPARDRFWKSRNLEIQKFGIQKISQVKILKEQIPSAQNVDKVWIDRKKRTTWPHFLHGLKTHTMVLNIFFRFFRPTQKIAWDGPKWGREVLFPANPDLDMNLDS